MSRAISRRRFMAATAATTAAGVGLTFTESAHSADKPALLGGKPVCAKGYSRWPIVTDEDAKAMVEIVRSGRWGRGRGENVDRFEGAYAQLMGAKHCLATSSGTSSLFASLAALEVGPGDEVIVPPYTYVATVNVVFLHHAMPVFVDTDAESFQIDARKIEAAITERTRAIIPAHIGGSPAEMDTILAIAKKHKLAVVEDACQAHFGAWRGRRLGSLGTTGCFSFQNSKNLTSGEGGAILCDDPRLAERLFTFHTNSHGRGQIGGGYQPVHGTNLRMTEFQGALLLGQMRRLEEQSKTRWENGQYLSSLMREIPGIAPAKLYDGCTQSAFHLYMFRYSKEQFAGMPRAKFLHALQAEGVPCSGGYRMLNKEPLFKATLTGRVYGKIYSQEEIARWEARNQCPANDQVCQEAVWFGQTMLLGPRSDMEQIAEAVGKIQKHAAELTKT